MQRNFDQQGCMMPLVGGLCLVQWTFDQQGCMMPLIGGLYLVHRTFDQQGRMMPLIGGLCLVRTSPARHNDSAPHWRTLSHTAEFATTRYRAYNTISNDHQTSCTNREKQKPNGQLSCPKIRLLHNNEYNDLIYLKGLKILGGRFSL